MFAWVGVCVCVHTRVRVSESDRERNSSSCLERSSTLSVLPLEDATSVSCRGQISTFLLSEELTFWKWAHCSVEIINCSLDIIHIVFPVNQLVLLIVEGKLCLYTATALPVIFIASTSFAHTSIHLPLFLSKPVKP